VTIRAALGGDDARCVMIFHLCPLWPNMAKSRPVLEVVNPSGLTEADWIAVNKVRRAYERGGWDAFWSEFETFGDDLMLQIMVLRTLFPDVMRQAIKDELAEAGFTLGELPGLLKKTMQLATEH